MQLLTRVADEVALGENLIGGRVLADDENACCPVQAAAVEDGAEGGAAVVVTGNVQVDRRYLERPGNVVIDDNCLVDAKGTTNAGIRIRRSTRNIASVLGTSWGTRTSTCRNWRPRRRRVVMVTSSGLGISGAGR